MIPFCNFSMCQNRIMTASNTSRKTSRYSMVSWVIALSISSRIILILPVAVLRLVERVPNWNVLVISADDEGCVVEEIIDNLGSCPGAIRVEEGKGSVFRGQQCAT